MLINELIFSNFNFKLNLWVLLNASFANKASWKTLWVWLSVFEYGEYGFVASGILYKTVCPSSLPRSFKEARKRLILVDRSHEAVQFGVSIRYSQLVSISRGGVSLCVWLDLRPLDPTHLAYLLFIFLNTLHLSRSAPLHSSATFRCYSLGKHCC